MHVLSGGRLQMEKRVYVPGAAPGETLELPVSRFLFRHPHGLDSLRRQMHALLQ